MLSITHLLRIEPEQKEIFFSNRFTYLDISPVQCADS